MPASEYLEKQSLIAGPPTSLALFLVRAHLGCRSSHRRGRDHDVGVRCSFPHHPWTTLGPIGRIERHRGMTAAGRELPVDVANQLAQLQTFRNGTPSACSTIGQPSRIFRTSLPVLPTSFRLLTAVSFLIAASIRQASDWFRQANLTSNRRGGSARV